MKKKTIEEELYFTGQLLIAMPGIMDERFYKTVIYICAHSEDGAMGLILNHIMTGISFQELLEQLEIDGVTTSIDPPIHFGGPVDVGRGFVLHTNDFKQEGTIEVDEKIFLTSTLDILKAIAKGDGPRKSLLALGYAGWSAGQLDEEIRANGWLQAPADDDLLFGADQRSKWEKSIAKIGINPVMLSGESGHA
ncbi:MAG: YqgE/AlgH family protein [Rhodospirillales bacterium]|tara:strand:- start:2682 stop:3260 length:579 start_codon:yes stop_codon:yes gene_type:complete